MKNGKKKALTLKSSGALHILFKFARNGVDKEWKIIDSLETHGVSQVE